MIVKSLFVEYYRTEVLHQRNDIIRLQTSAYGRALAGIQLIKQKKPYFRNCSLSLCVGRFRSRSCFVHILYWHVVYSINVPPI